MLSTLIYAWFPEGERPSLPVTGAWDSVKLLAFSLNELGACRGERSLDRVYDGERDANIYYQLKEFRHIAARKASVTQADTHIHHLWDMSLAEYNIDGLWDTDS